MKSGRLPPNIRRSMESGDPAIIVSCSADGVPNTTYISQIYYVDEHHVALSYQFFNKTIRNVRENPHVCACLYDEESPAHWILQIRFDHSETEGPIFDEMDMQIEAIASATGMSGVFKLKAADFYEVISVEHLSMVPSHG